MGSQTGFEKNFPMRFFGINSMFRGVINLRELPDCAGSVFTLGIGRT